MELTDNSYSFLFYNKHKYNYATILASANVRKIAEVLIEANTLSKIQSSWCIGDMALHTFSVVLTSTTVVNMQHIRF